MAPKKRPQNRDSDAAVQIIRNGREGATYLVSYGQPAYKAPQIDATKLKQYSRNYYGAGMAKKLSAMFFSGNLEFQVTDEAGERDEDLEAEIDALATAPAVALYSKIKMSWTDKFWFGAGFFNDVWEQEGPRWVLQEIRRLPPESFASPAQKLGPGLDINKVAFGAILKGVVGLPDGTLRYFQTIGTGQQEELTQILKIQESTCSEVGGEPEVLPMTPIITMLDFAWKAQMQKLNRVGSPILLLKITNPKADDITYGEKLIKNWGKDTGFILRSNMEVVEFDVSDKEVALDTINKLADMALDYWVPTGILNRGEGTRIGNSGDAELRLLYGFIAGVHREIEQAWQPVIQKYLDANGYQGYRVKIKIEDPQVDDSEIKLNQAKVGAETGLLQDNEVRTRLGAAELTEEELAELPANKKAAQAQALAEKMAKSGPLPGQNGGQAGQAKTGDLDGQPPGPGQSGFNPAQWQEVKAGTPGAKKDPTTGKMYQFKQSARTVTKKELKDPNLLESALVDQETQQLQAAIDTLARNIMRHL